MKLKTLIFAIILIVIPSQVFSQQIKCQVKVIAQKISHEKRYEVEDLDSKIKDYIENYEWLSEKDFTEPLDISIQILFESIVFTFENKFTAKIAVFASDGSYYGDKHCEFPYSPNDMLTHDEFQFEPLTGLLDYFIYLLIGNEMDKKSLYGGTPYFEKALKIADAGNYSRYNKWWDRRLKYIENILKETHNPFREMVYNFEQAYKYYKQELNDVAVEFLIIALDFIPQIKGKNTETDHLKQFFERNHKRLAEVAYLQKEGTLLKTLQRIDETHKDYYKNYPSG